MPGGSGVVGFSDEVEPPAPVGPNLGRNRQRSIDQSQALTLLDVELDKGGDPIEAALDRTEATRDPRLPRPSPPPKDTPSESLRSPARSGSTAPVESREPRHATPKRALLPLRRRRRRRWCGRASPRSDQERQRRRQPPTVRRMAPPSGTESRWLPVTIRFWAAGSPR